MSGLAHLWQSVRGWVYPPACGVCDVPLTTARQVERPFLCGDCESTLKAIEDGYCEICGQRDDAPQLRAFQCANCKNRELAFDFAVSAWRSAGVARELMHRFKYGQQVHLSRLLGSLISGVWRDERLLLESWVVVPVPLHPKRLRERGFNQSREISVEMMRWAPPGIKLEMCELLSRTRHMVRQAQLDRKDRFRNPNGAFESKSSRLPKRFVDREKKLNLLLVDDVITTGSTVSECASVLREALEPDRIAAISVLRG